MTALPSSAGASRLSVLSVSSTAQLWGAELALATYLRHRPETVDSHVLCLSDGPLVQMLRKQGISAAAASLDGRPSWREAFAFWRRLYGDLRRSKPDAIYACGNKAAILCAPPAVAANVPLIWHRVDLAMRPTAVRVVSAYAAGVIAVSRASAADVPERRLLCIVPPPVRLAEDFTVGDDRPVASIGSVGQLHPIKGHHDVIAAAALLREEFPAVKVVIAGGRHPAFPRYPERLRELAAEAGLADRVEIAGHVDRIEDVYERLTVLASGTYRDSDGIGPEALGAAIAEASWAGLPVVATLGGGTGEVVNDGVSGRLVAPRRPDLLADAIASYLRDPSRSRAAGDAGMALARSHFRPQPLADGLFTSLRHAAGNRVAAKPGA